LTEFSLQNAISAYEAAKAAILAKGQPGIAALARIAGPSGKSQNAAGEGGGRWLLAFKERTAHFDDVGGLSRAVATREALDWCVAEWRCENPPRPSDPAAGCVQCGKPLGIDAVATLARNGHAWLHRSCWADYDSHRQEMAETVALDEAKLPLRTE